MSAIKPSAESIARWRQHRPHDSGADHYWALLRSGEILLVSRALRQCEIGAVRGEACLCRLIEAERDPHCCRCHSRSLTAVTP